MIFVEHTQFQEAISTSLKNKIEPLKHSHWGAKFLFLLRRLRSGKRVWKCSILDAYLTSKEVAKLLNISDATLKRWRAKNLIPHFKVGNTVRYSMDEILKWKEAHQRS